MENQIVCPRCKKTIENNSVVDAAIKGVGSGTEYMICDCGRKITYWQMVAQLRKQHTTARRFQNWVQTLFHRRG